MYSPAPFRHGRCTPPTGNLPTRGGWSYLRRIARAGGPAFENAPSRGRAVQDEGSGLTYPGPGGLELYGLPDWSRGPGVRPHEPDAGCGMVRERSAQDSRRGESRCLARFCLTSTARRASCFARSKRRVPASPTTTPETAPCWFATSSRADIRRCGRDRSARRPLDYLSDPILNLVSIAGKPTAVRSGRRRLEHCPRPPDRRAAAPWTSDRSHPAGRATAMARARAQGRAGTRARVRWVAEKKAFTPYRWSCASDSGAESCVARVIK